MVLESFTRCFNPLEHSGCSKTDKQQGGKSKKDGTSGGAGSSQKSGISPTSSQLFGLNIGSGGAEGLASTLARAVSRSSSSSEDIAPKKTRRVPSAEALEERSMKRKLEIFRGTGKEVSRPPPRLDPRQQQQRSSRQSTSPPSAASQAAQNNHKNISSVVGADLALSDDEEELIRLQTQSRKRFACGMNVDGIARGGSPISSVARLFNLGISEAQKPFGLCFATPVRTASQEDIANLSDDKLTDDEFLRRHCQGHCGTGAGGGNSATVSPDGADRSYNEEETISSTLYFDQKYSHVVQTRPPMPLFQENMLSCTEMKFDEITKVIKRQRSPNSDHPPVELVTKDRRTPRRKVVAGRGSPFRRGGGGSPRMGSDDYPPPSPIRIRDESLSINTQSAEEELSSFPDEGKGCSGGVSRRKSPPTSAEI